MGMLKNWRPKGSPFILGHYRTHVSTDADPESSDGQEVRRRSRR